MRFIKPTTFNCFHSLRVFASGQRLPRPRCRPRLRAHRLCVQIRMSTFSNLPALDTHFANTRSLSMYDAVSGSYGFGRKTLVFAAQLVVVCPEPGVAHVVLLAVVKFGL